MSEAKHDLVHELPEFVEQIRALKVSDGHFLRLSDEYHALVKELHLIEAGLETPSDAYTEELKKRRLAVKDELVAMLKAADAG